MTDRWKHIIDVVDFAYQPVVNMFTGQTFGFEILLRNYRDAGFQKISDFFDAAFDEGHLFKVDGSLRERAIKKFLGTRLQHSVRLLYNLDNRLLANMANVPRKTQRMLDKQGMKSELFCFELSERHSSDSQTFLRTIEALQKDNNFKIAIDDFGTGYSGMKLLYNTEPDIIKLDRFFISRVDTDMKKRHFVESIVKMAQILGITVIAEGVERPEEFYVCKEIGCEYAQGYLIQKPQTDISKLEYYYPKINEINLLQKRRSSIRNIPDVMINPVKPFSSQVALKEVIAHFKQHPELTMVPVVNALKEPIGIITEKRIRPLIYSPYGYALAKNRDQIHIDELVEPITVCSRHIAVEHMLDQYNFSASNRQDGMLLTDGDRYVGHISDKQLLELLHAQHLKLAVNKNPLSGLPGNIAVQEFIEETVRQRQKNYYWLYFDFNHFKPFNDYYGFRRGDRAIKLFAEIVEKQFLYTHALKGHIGGDDFFVGIKEADFSGVIAIARATIEAFGLQAASLYDRMDRRAGYIRAKGRDGTEGNFPLLTVACAVLVFKSGLRMPPMHEIDRLIGVLKKCAKREGTHLIAASCLPRPYFKNPHHL